MDGQTKRQLRQTDKQIHRQTDKQNTHTHAHKINTHSHAYINREDDVFLTTSLGQKGKILNYSQVGLKKMAKEIQEI